LAFDPGPSAGTGRKSVHCPAVFCGCGEPHWAAVLFKQGAAHAHGVPGPGFCPFHRNNYSMHLAPIPAFLGGQYFTLPKPSLSTISTVCWALSGQIKLFLEPARLAIRSPVPNPAPHPVAGGANGRASSVELNPNPVAFAVLSPAILHGHFTPPRSKNTRGFSGPAQNAGQGY
jgi:hypothetical protein